MSVTHTIRPSVASSAGGAVSGSYTETGTTETSIDQAYPAASTNVLQACAFTISGLQSIILLSSQDMTIKTNSSGAPANTIALKAGVPLVWSITPGNFANPSTVNVTAFYVTCVNAATLKAKILVA